MINDVMVVARSFWMRRCCPAESEEEFKQAHYQDTCDCLQAEYYLEDKLIAVGFLDRGNISLSSSYFIYDCDYQQYSLGTFSILKEVEYCQEQGFEYYYLGYYIKDNKSMAYKNRFYPHQQMDWADGIWKDFNKIKGK